MQQDQPSVDSTLSSSVHPTPLNSVSDISQQMLQPPVTVQFPATSSDGAMLQMLQPPVAVQLPATSSDGAMLQTLQPPVSVQLPATSSDGAMLQIRAIQCSVPAGDERHSLRPNGSTYQEVGFVGHHIKYCHTCHAVLPANGNRSLHVCVAWNWFRSNNLMFTCYVCVDQMPLEHLGAHIVMEHVGTNALENSKDKWYSYYCSLCDIFMYATWEVIIKHRMTRHNGRGGYNFRDTVLRPKFDARLPWVSTVMRKVICDYNVYNNRNSTLYACLVCDDWRTEFCRNVRPNFCNFCRRKNNKYFCLSCNVVFTCPRDIFEVHRYSFEHVYITLHKAAAFANVAIGGR